MFCLPEWTQEAYSELLAFLLENAEAQYAAFNQKLIPGYEKILGVRAPMLHRIAKQIAKGNWCGFLSIAQNGSHEERLLQGMVIGYAKMDIETRLSCLDAFLPQIDNWAICDLCCGCWKFAKVEPQPVWNYVRTLTKREKPYEIRVGVVMLLNYYLDRAHLKDLFHTFSAITQEDYYVRMAVAWAVSLCYVAFPQETTAYLKKQELCTFTHNKSIQKICESRQVEKQEKEQLRALRRAC